MIGTLLKDSDSLHLYSLALLYSWVGIHSAKKSTKVIRTSLMRVIKCQDISIVNREVNWSCWLLNSSWNLQDTTGGIIQEIKPVEQSHSKNISKVYWFLCFLDKAEIRKCLNSKNSWYNSISNLQRTCHRAISVHSGNQIFSSKAGISPLLIRKELKSTASPFPTMLSQFMLRTEFLEKGLVPRWPS